MELIERVTVDEVIAVWLKAELHSERFGRKVVEAMGATGTRESELERPDWWNPDENQRRARILASLRGWNAVDRTRESYMMNFYPDELEWWRGRIDATDVADLLFIDWDYWVEVTGGDRRVSTLAAEMQKVGPNGAEDWGIRDSLLTGRPVPEIILVDAGPGTPKVILEGHVRATGMALAGGQMPKVTALLGRGEAVRRWGCY